MTRILILEDSDESLKALTAMVKSVSDKVAAVPVKSLNEARGAVKDADAPFQAFLLDINLDADDKNDISGIIFAGEVRAMKKYAFTPIVMITSLVNMELKAYRELHCYQYLIKPYNEDEVKTLISRLLFMQQPDETKERFIIVKKSGINYKLSCSAKRRMFCACGWGIKCSVCHDKTPFGKAAGGEFCADTQNVRGKYGSY